MPNIKLKNEIGIEQIYTDVTKIKLPTVDGGSFKTFYEGEPVVILSDFSDPVALKGEYNGDYLDITTNGTINLESAISLNKKLPLGINVNVKNYPEGNINIKSVGLVNVSDYATASIVPPASFSAMNIKQGVTILGITGNATPMNTTSDYYNESLLARLEHTTNIENLFYGSHLWDFSFLASLDLSKYESVSGLLAGSMIEELYLPGLAATNLKAICKDCTELTKVFLESSNATQAESAFEGCTNLESIEGIDFSKVTHGSYMFMGCTNLESLPPLNFSNINSSTYNVFKGCTKLKSVEITHLQRTTYLNGWFSGCTSLEQVQIPTITYSFTSPSNAKEIFKGCYNLKCLILSDLTETNFSSLKLDNLFANCPHFTGTIDPVYNPEGLRDGVIKVQSHLVEQIKKRAEFAAYADLVVGIDQVTELKDIICWPGYEKVSKELKLYGFTNISQLSITSSDKRIVKITNIRYKDSFVKFNLEFSGKDGEAIINVNILGDKVFNGSFKTKFTLSPAVTWELNPVETSTYYFILNNANYYENNNQKIDSSYALSRLAIWNHTDLPLTIALDCKQSSENCCDFGILSRLDNSLSLSNNEDSTSVAYKSFRSETHDSDYRVIYMIPAGEHFIDIKYKKDGSVHKGSDTFQFTVVPVI